MCDDDRCALKTDVFTLLYQWALGKRKSNSPADAKDSLAAWTAMMDKEKQEVKSRQGVVNSEGSSSTTAATPGTTGS